MIMTRIIRDLKDTRDLCETYSIDGYKLLQQDTGITYGKSVIDPIYGYENGFPISKHIYIETDELDTDEESESEDIGDMKSNKNISAGQYFSIADRLFYSTSSIASGDDIAIGTNCEEKTLVDALNDLNEEEN